MFSCLTFFYKARLKLSRLSRNNQNSNIGLTCSHDHVRHKVFMPRSIKESKSPDSIRKVQLCVFDGNTFQSLSWVNIRNASQFPRLHVILFSIELGSGPLLFIHLIEFLENVSSECGLTGVNMTDENDVGVFLFENFEIGVLVFGPFL